MKYTEAVLLRLQPGTMNRIRQIAARDGTKPAEVMRRAIWEATRNATLTDYPVLDDAKTGA